MSKHFSAFYVSWREAKNRPVGLFANETTFGRAAAEAVEAKLNDLADDGWIIDRVIPAGGLTPQQTSAFTIIAFK